VRVGERGISPERHAELLHEMGLDRPLYVQFFDYVGGVLQGDLGISVITHRPVMDEFLTLFPATVELAIFALIFATLIGLPAGILAAVKRGSVYDHTVMGVSLTGYSMPIFWWGLLLILFFSVFLGWTPVAKRLGDDFFIDEVTGFMLIDTLLDNDPLQQRRVPQRVASPHPADHRARHRAAGRDRAHDALRHAGGAGRGLHPHRAGQGALASIASSRSMRCAMRWCRW
jgi:hypothetical protein